MSNMMASAHVGIVYQQVKRTAMAELQKAVAAAERRAMDLVTNERLKMERVLLGATSPLAATATGHQGITTNSSLTKPLLFG